MPGLMSDRKNHPTNSKRTLKFEPVRHLSQVVEPSHILELQQSAEQKQLKMLKAGNCAYDTELPMGMNIWFLNFSAFAAESDPYRNNISRGCLCINPHNRVKEIDLSNNKLDQFVDDPTFEHVCISGLNRLQTLNMRNNNLKIKLQSKFFSGAQFLHTLLLGGNRVRLLSNDSVILPETLGNLRILDLSSNHIDTLPYLEFHLLSNMEVLDLS